MKFRNLLVPNQLRVLYKICIDCLISNNKHKKTCKQLRHHLWTPFCVIPQSVFRRIIPIFKILHEATNHEYISVYINYYYNIFYDWLNTKNKCSTHWSIPSFIWNLIQAIWRLKYEHECSGVRWKSSRL